MMTVCIYPTSAMEVFDVTGAGDRVLASLGFALAAGSDVDEAVAFANLAAGVVVGKMGTATASIAEIRQYESLLCKSSAAPKLKTTAEIVELSRDLRSLGKKLVFTNGCFDILHAGHIKCLQEAKTFGDVLIVGLNSDVSVKALKGVERPINGQIDRAAVLSSLAAVDYVVIFEDTALNELIREIKPHTMVKGGDYKGKRVVGEDVAEEFQFVDFLEHRSTTEIIEKIRSEGGK